MIRKFRRIFRSPSTATTIKNETTHQTSNSDDASHNKQGASSISNRLYTGRKKNHNLFIYIFFLYLTQLRLYTKVNLFFLCL